jgi:hypothetical protein
VARARARLVTMKASWQGSIRSCGAAALAVLLIAGTVSAQARGPGQGPGQGAGPDRPPGPGAGPFAGAGRGGPGAMLEDSLSGPGPIELLLGRRDALGLSEAQVRDLERIAASLRRQNAPLIRELLERRRQLQPLIGMRPRDMAPAQRALIARHAERARPIIQQVQRNNARAMNRVGQVLTVPQKQQLRTWLQQPELHDAAPGDQQRLRMRGPGGLDGAGGAGRPDDGATPP